jgi:hypothetical protein
VSGRDRHRRREEVGENMLDLLRMLTETIETLAKKGG